MTYNLVDTLHIETNLWSIKQSPNDNDLPLITKFVA